MADLISLLIWQPMGAEFDADITCDAVGSAIHDGGMSARARDLARFGQLILEDGSSCATPRRAGTVADPRPAPLDPDVRAAFAASDSEPFLTGGWYRNQFWFVPGPLGRPAAVPGHPRPDGAGRPGDPDRLGEVSLVAGRRKIPRS